MPTVGAIYKDTTKTNKHAFNHGSVQGITEMMELGLTTPAQFIDSAICISKEFKESKAEPEPPYVAQAKRIADSYTMRLLSEKSGQT